MATRHVIVVDRSYPSLTRGPSNEVALKLAPLLDEGLEVMAGHPYPSSAYSHCWKPMNSSRTSAAPPRSISPSSSAP